MCTKLRVEGMEKRTRRMDYKEKEKFIEQGTDEIWDNSRTVRTEIPESESKRKY